MIARSPKTDPATGDYVVVAGELVFVDGAEYIAQSLQERFRFFMGEYKYDVNFGMPYFQQILIKGFNANIIRGAFTNMALSCPGVSAVKSLTLDFNHSARSMAVNIEVQSDVGLLPISFSIAVGP